MPPKVKKEIPPPTEEPNPEDQVDYMLLLLYCATLESA